jgi:dTMP kinase
LYTREPTDSEVGREIRRRLLAGDLPPEDALELFVRDRAQHVRDEIEPALAAGVDVVSDRYKYSTVVYQAVQGVPVERTVAANDFPAPDQTFILTLGLDRLLERIASRDQARDQFETRAFQAEVCALFERLPALFPDERFAFVETERAPEAIVAELVARATA